MDGETLRARLRSDNETELSRLGSSKALYALTGGEMDATSVRAAVAADAARAADVLDDWAGDEPDGAAAELFEAAAATAGDHASLPAADADATDATPYPIYDDLAALDDTPARVGGLLARSLLVGETVAQVVGFFVGDADPQGADEFRTVRSEVESVRDDAAALLDDVCDDEADWVAAEDAGETVLEGAYGFYVETLESMGIKPKNVC
jgi:hypothetical protein